MSLSITPSCELCKSSVNVFRCSACNVVFYCDENHQALDKPIHKKECDAIKKSYDNIASLERKLAECPPYNGTLHQTLNRMVLEEALFSNDDSLVKELSEVNTFTAVEKALNHCIDVLHRRRINHMDLQYMAPDLFLRLGNDQKCYDFVKWYATTPQEDTDDEETDNEDIDVVLTATLDQSQRHIENMVGLNKNRQRKNTNYWRDMVEPYLDITNANVLEPVDHFIGETALLSHKVSVTLLKIRLLQDIKNLKNSIFLYERLPNSIVDKIRKELVNSSYIHNDELMSTGKENMLVQKVESQVEQLYADINVSNKFLWPGILEPDVYIDTEVDTKFIYIDKSSSESEQRAISIIKMCHNAWAETPGSHEMIENLSRNN